MKETVLMRVNDNNQQTVTVDGLALWLGKPGALPSGRLARHADGAARISSELK